MIVFVIYRNKLFLDEMKESWFLVVGLGTAGKDPERSRGLSSRSSSLNLVKVSFGSHFQWKTVVRSSTFVRERTVISRNICQQTSINKWFLCTFEVSSGFL